MSKPLVKGWCPGAYRPMRSGDGLVYRVRPFFAQISVQQALGLANLAMRYGNGMIDLTNRANLQIRGISEANGPAVLEGIGALGLLDDDPTQEARRNILVSPFWQSGDVTENLTRKLLNHLPKLPDFPAKIGFSIDTGTQPCLTISPADFRFERSGCGLILRADGARLGRSVTLETAMPILSELVDFFVANMTDTRRRMAKILKNRVLPEEWRQTAPLEPMDRVTPGLMEIGGRVFAVLGGPFGQIGADDLRRMLEDTTAAFIRVTPWRLIGVPAINLSETTGFITQPDDTRLKINACAGAPYCSQATVMTRRFAHDVQKLPIKDIHISGCEKGCALPRAADLTLVGRNGVFDLVRDGNAWDRPVATGLSFEDALKKSGGS